MPAAMSKSKDKKAGREPQKVTPTSKSTGAPASGYDPLSGNFQTFETAPGPSHSQRLVNSRFQNIDDTDDHSNPSGPGNEYDSISNNGSWSGESDDLKEKAPHPPRRQESIPGADNDKREKIRQKNERKHQRQKEKRAQELRERCSGYLMSRKLEALTRQLVAMGFSQERAMMALILNEGKVEESVAWLFEAGEEEQQSQQDLDGGGNLKIDISEELNRIREMEVRHQASAQEVERAIVSCQGDLEKAEETLKAQKERPPTPSNPDEIMEPVTLPRAKLPIPSNQNPMIIPAKSTSSYAMQREPDEKDFGHIKVLRRVGPSVDPGANAQVLKKIMPQPDLGKQQQTPVSTERRWPSSVSDASVSFQLPSATQVAPSLPMRDALYGSIGNDLKNLQLGSIQEPVVIEQRHHYPMAGQASSSTLSSSPTVAAFGRYARSVEVEPRGSFSPVTASMSLMHNEVSAMRLGNKLPYQSTASDNQQYYQTQHQLVSSSSTWDSLGTSQGNREWSRGSTSPLLTAASSLGLFSGLGASRSPSTNWSTDGSCDYSNIDWSLNGEKFSGATELWRSEQPLLGNPRTYDSFGYGPGGTSGRTSWATASTGPNPRLHDGGVVSKDPSGVVPRDWASSFEENDLFGLKRQFVSFPSI